MSLATPRRTPRLLAVAPGLVMLLVSAFLATFPAPARASTTATLTAADGVLVDGCADYPLGYDLNLPDGATQWSAQISVTGPRGFHDDAIVAAEYGVPSASPSRVLCGFRSGEDGEFVVTLSNGRYVDAAGAQQSIYAAPTSFHLAEPRERTRLRVSTRTPRFNQIVRLECETTIEIPGGYGPVRHARVRLQVRAPGGWRNTRLRFRTHGDGRDVLLLRWNTRARVTLRLQSPDGRFWVGTSSRRVTIGTRS